MSALHWEVIRRYSGLNKSGLHLNSCLDVQKFSRNFASVGKIHIFSSDSIRELGKTLHDFSLIVLF